MKDIWRHFGFDGHIYRSTRLEPTDEDFELFVGREEEAEELLTLMDQSGGCVIVVSGDVGVGKTSFVNVQQFAIWQGFAGIGTKCLPARHLTQISYKATATELAHEATQSLLASIELICADVDHTIPKNAKKIRSWLSHEGTGSGGQLSIGIPWLFEFGGGHETTIPSVKDATVENWRVILAALTAECKTEFDVDGVTICLDNAEEMPIEELCKILKAFRDTLFRVPDIWWIVIGLSGLYDNIHKYDKSVSEVIQGEGIEITPLTSDQLHELIERRVKKYRAMPDAISPLSPNIHDQLYKAFRGRVRLVLNTADNLVRRIISEVRGRARSTDEVAMREDPAGQKLILDQAVREVLIDDRIPDELARASLARLARRSIKRKELTTKQRDLVSRLSAGSILAPYWRDLGTESQEVFQDTVLQPLVDAELLWVSPGDKSINLFGYAAIADEMGILESALSDDQF